VLGVLKGEGVLKQWRHPLFSAVALRVSAHWQSGHGCRVQHLSGTRESHPEHTLQQGRAGLQTGPPHPRAVR
jgi:hypothetical protein